MLMCTSPPRSTPSEGCSASGSSRSPRPAMPVFSAGWAGSGRCAWSGSRAPAATALAWLATSARPVSGSWRWTAATGRTAAARASPTPRRRQRCPGRPVRGRAAGAPKGRDGAVEAIRALMVAKRSAAGERTRTINQARALVLTGPEDLRARFTGHTVAALVAELASLRPRPGSTVGYATRIALRELGRRAVFLDGQLERPGELIVPLVTARAPGLLALYGIGPNTAALLLIAAGDHPGRLRSEAAWAHLCAAAPIPASSGKVTRHRLNPGGDRQANHALWRIVFTRMGSDPATRAYVERRTKEGKSKAEIIRCLKRYAARQVYPHLRPAGD